MADETEDINEHLLEKQGQILFRSGGNLPMAANSTKFRAWPTGGAVALRIEFGDGAQVTMELGLAEVEDLLKVIDQALGPDNNNEGPGVAPEC